MENSITYLIIIEAIVLIVFSIIIGIIGSRRKIGFAGAFFLSLFLTPIVGLLFVYSSDKKPDEVYDEREIDYLDEENEGVNDGVNEGVFDVGYSNVGYEKNDVGYSNVGYRKENDFGYEKNNVGFTGKKIIRNVVPKTPEKRDLKHKISIIIQKLRKDQEQRKCKDFL
jgi:hypothetical protein